MKRLSAFIVFILLVAFFVSAEPSINDLISEMPADKIEAFFNGETIEMYSLDGEYVPSIAMDGSMGKSKALKDYENDNSTAVEIDNSIFYYCDSGFVASKPTEEDVIKYFYNI